MLRTVEDDLRASAWAFKQLVWPAISPWCGGGRLEPVELSTAKGLARDFDVLAGIDAWQLCDQRGYMRGIASRVQWPPAGLRRNGQPWQTFTVRRRRDTGTTTEFEKRLDAIRSRDAGALYPALTVQAYLKSGRGPLLSAAVMRTRDLYEHIAEHGAPTRRTTNAEFFYLAWSRLAIVGLPIRVWPDDRNGDSPPPPLDVPDTRHADQLSLWAGN